MGLLLKRVHLSRSVKGILELVKQNRDFKTRTRAPVRMAVGQEAWFTTAAAFAVLFGILWVAPTTCGPRLLLKLPATGRSHLRPALLLQETFLVPMALLQ